MAETCRRLRCLYNKKFTYLSTHLLVLVLTLWTEIPHFTIFRFAVTHEFYSVALKPKSFLGRLILKFID